MAPVVLPGAAQRPYGGWFDAAADKLDALVEQVVIHRGEITFHVRRADLVDGDASCCATTRRCASSSSPA